jgi:hypothetical protein
VNGELRRLMPELCDDGLNAIEAYHSDHSQEETDYFLGLAQHYGLLVTGGSDFHGAMKPGVMLGTGWQGNLRVPDEVLEKLKAAAGAGAIPRLRKP